MAKPTEVNPQITDAVTQSSSGEKKTGSKTSKTRKKKKGKK